MRLLNHEPWIPQAGTKERHPLFDTYLNCLPGTSGRTVHFDHHLHIRKLKLIFYFLNPFLMQLGQRFYHCAKRHFFHPFQGSSPQAQIQFLGEKKINTGFPVLSSTVYALTATP